VNPPHDHRRWSWGGFHDHAQNREAWWNRLSRFISWS
jgi:hypothetical protein